MDDKRPHEHTAVTLHPLTIEEALKKAMDAGPYPEEEKKPKRKGSGAFFLRTSQAGRRSEPAK